MSRILFALGTTASLLSSTAYADAPRVATDIAPVHSLVARVMDGVGTPDLVIAQGASPHEYSLRPSDAQALQEADVVFWIGEDLTPWLEGSIETLSRDAEVIELLGAKDLTLLDFRESALFEAHDHGDDHDGHDEDDHEDHSDDHHDDDHEEHGKSDHEDDHDKDHAEHADHSDEHDDAEGHDHDDHHGHAHGDHDPHAWLSPENAAIWLNVIAAALSTADPDNAGAYFANAAEGREDLTALADEINAELDPVRGESFVVFHDAYQYFEVAFDFPASGAISLSDASDPSPARIAEIRDRIANEGVTCVLSEPQYNPNLVVTVMDGTEAKTAVLDPLGSSIALGPDLYPQLLKGLAASLAECL